MAWAPQMVYSYILGSFFTPNFASVPQDCNKKKAHDTLSESSRLFSEVWKVCTDIQLNLCMLIKGCPFLVGLPGWAGAFWPLGDLATEQSVRGVAIQGSALLWVVAFLTGPCFKRCTNEGVSDSNKLWVPKADVNWLRILHWCARCCFHDFPDFNPLSSEVKFLFY